MFYACLKRPTLNLPESCCTSPVGCTLLWVFKAPPPVSSSSHIHVFALMSRYVWEICRTRRTLYVSKDAAFLQTRVWCLQNGLLKTAFNGGGASAGSNPPPKQSNVTREEEEEAACKVNVFSIPLMPPDIFLHLSPLLVPCEAAAYNRASHAFRPPQRKAALWKEAAD